MIYQLPLIFCFLGHILYDSPLKYRRGGILWGILFVTLVLIMGLRYKVGADTYNYMSFFEYCPNIYNWTVIHLSGFEPGFTYLSAIIKTFTDNIYVYQTILAFITTYLLMSFVYKNTQYRFMGMLILFVAVYPYFLTEIMRESIAVVGLLTIYPLCEKKKYLLYSLIVLLLVTFHSSACVGWIIPFVHRLRLNRFFFFILVSFLLFSFALFAVIEYMASFPLFARLLRYNEQLYVGYLWCGLRFLYFAVLPMSVVYICKKKFGLTTKYEGIVCLQILFGFGLWIVPIIFQRLINYTIVFYIISMVNMLETVIHNPEYKLHISLRVCKLRSQLARLVILLTIILHMTYYIHLDFYKIWIPYHSIFNPIEVLERSEFVQGET